jgi:hypothetical protein
VRATKKRPELADLKRTGRSVGDGFEAAGRAAQRPDLEAIGVVIRLLAGRPYVRQATSPMVLVFIANQVRDEIIAAAARLVPMVPDEEPPQAPTPDGVIDFAAACKRLAARRREGRRGTL